MPTNRTNFAQGRRSVIYGRVSDILRASPRLAEVRTWLLGEGEVQDAVGPTQSMMPWVMGYPRSKSVTRVAEGRNFIEFAVRLRVATPGTSWHDMLNLWDAIEDALAQDEPTHGTTVRDYLTGRSQGRCDGALFDGIDQDATSTIVDTRGEVMGLVGEGSVIFPFTKRA